MKHFVALAIFILASFCRLAIPCYAGDNAVKKFPADRVAKETALYVETLELKGDDAKKFTKLYTEYRRKIHNAVEKNRPPYKGNSSQLSNEQNDKNIRARFASSRAILDIREQYYPKFLKIISSTQYEKLINLEQKIFEKSRNERHRRNSTRSSSKTNKTTSHNHSSSKSKTSHACVYSCAKSTGTLKKDMEVLQQEMKTLEKNMKIVKYRLRTI